MVFDELERQIWHCERPYRPQLLEQILKDNTHLPQTTINEYIEDVWYDYEMPIQEKSRWQRLLKKYKPQHNIVEPITVYRGSNNIGPAWTTDIAVARWFAHRNVGFEESYYYGTPGFDKCKAAGLFNCNIWQAIVKPTGILFAQPEGTEKEIVIKHWSKTAFVEAPVVIERIITNLRESRVPRITEEEQR